ncbi:MAG: YbgC/FadM family acyl-CoA thioesterase [Myxococcota bacterium]
MQQPHIYPVNIFYEDTDFSGVVYYANYLRYFERARSDFFGLDELLEMYKQTGVGFAVYRADIHYREGAKFGDRLEIRTLVKKESDYRIQCDQSVWRGGATQPLVKAIIQMVCLDRDQKLVQLPQRVLDILARNDAL